MSKPDTSAVDPRSYVKIVKLTDGDYAVATYDTKDGRFFQMTGQWFGKSKGVAMLHAQRLKAQGYRTKGGAA